MRLNFRRFGGDLFPPSSGKFACMRCVCASAPKSKKLQKKFIFNKRRTYAEKKCVDRPLEIWFFVTGTPKGSWTSPTSHHGS